jgi:hypothetical protein
MDSSKPSILSNLTSFFRRLFVDKPQGLTYSTSMAITFDDEYKNKVAYSIVISINKAMKAGELHQHELSEVCTYVTVAMKGMKSHDELKDFLRKMAARWGFFTNILQDITKENDVVNGIEKSFLNRTDQ